MKQIKISMYLTEKQIEFFMNMTDESITKNINTCIQEVYNDKSASTPINDNN